MQQQKKKGESVEKEKLILKKADELFDVLKEMDYEEQIAVVSIIQILINSTSNLYQDSLK